MSRLSVRALGQTKQEPGGWLPRLQVRLAPAPAHKTELLPVGGCRLDGVRRTAPGAGARAKWSPFDRRPISRRHPGEALQRGISHRRPRRDVTGPWGRQRTGRWCDSESSGGMHVHSSTAQARRTVAPRPANDDRRLLYNATPTPRGSTCASSSWSASCQACTTPRAHDGSGEPFDDLVQVALALASSRPSIASTLRGGPLFDLHRAEPSSGS